MKILNAKNAWNVRNSKQYDTMATCATDTINIVHVLIIFITSSENDLTLAIKWINLLPEFLNLNDNIIQS